MAQTILPLVCATVALAIMTSRVSPATTRMCTLDDRRRNTYMCGSMWSEMLSMLCAPHGYSGKRSIDDDFNPLALHQNTAGSDMKYYRTPTEDVFLPKSKALAYIKTVTKRDPGSRGWQHVNDAMVFMGPVCECCHNKCSIFEMVQYCLYPDRALANFGMGR